MKIEFSQAEIDNEVNKVIIEDDDLEFSGEYIEGEGKKFILTGIAVIEGETYHDFKIQVELKEETTDISAEKIMLAEWEWYDYLC